MLRHILAKGVGKSPTACARSLNVFETVHHRRFLHQFRPQTVSISIPSNLQQQYARDASSKDRLLSNIFFAKNVKGEESNAAKRESEEPAGAGGPGPSGGGPGGGSPNPTTTASGKQPPNFFNVFLLTTALTVILLMMTSSETAEEITWQEFKTRFLTKEQQEQIDFLEVVNGTKVRVYLRKTAGNNVGLGASYFFTIPSSEIFERRLEEIEKELGMAASNRIPLAYTEQIVWKNELMNYGPVLLWIGFFVILFRRMSTAEGQAGGIFSMNKARIKTAADSATKITFKDVAGMDEAKQEIQEFVSFLKEAKRFTALGAKVPRGAILMGPPGTGKTLLAKAVAGEAGTPFFSISGSDFVEMFVGVGPARVRDLFKKARESAPCIVYIDEIDAIGRPRGKAGMIGGNDERENTLNQLLVEMDGFKANADVIVLASTNVDAENLDKALLRPGRFDRQIHIDRPDLKERIDIYKVHLAKIKLADDIQKVAERLSELTPGFTGADIANVCNEGALFAAREKKDSIDLIDLEKAIDRVIGGLEKKTKVMAPEEKKIVAYHEAGHAIVSWFLKHCDPLLKITIIPRGIASLGYAQYLPRETFIRTKDQMLDIMCAAMGGRAAERLVFGHLSTGAQDDLGKITKMAYAQVSTFGMSPNEIGPVSFPIPGDPETSIQKPYSEATAEKIDLEVRKLVQHVFQRTEELLATHRDKLDKVAQFLLDNEVMNQHQFEEIVGPRPEGAARPQRASDFLRDAEAAKAADTTASSDESTETTSESK